MPNHYVGDLLHTMAISGLSRVRTELLPLAVIAALAPHPVQMHSEFPGHGYFGNLASAPHGEVKERTAPLRLAAHSDLRGFHQQKPQQHVALLADVTEPARRRLAQGASFNDSSSLRPAGRHNAFLRRRPSLSASTCN
jgi:hypothetical protein